MPRELCWAMDGPSQRAHGAMIAGSRAQRDPDGRGKPSWLLLGRLPEV